MTGLTPVIIRPHLLNIALTYVDCKQMVGVPHISSLSCVLHHTYSVFSKSDRRVVAIVIVVYLSSKGERRRSACMLVSAGGITCKYEVLHTD
jgi:hypothetical protein